MELPEENKIIRDKLSSVVDLPAGYTPNLQSKWELLQAGLEPEKKKRKLYFSITRIGIAASLLLIGGTGMIYYLLLNQSKQLPHRAEISIPGPEAPVPVTAVEIAATEQVMPLKKMKRKPKHDKETAVPVHPKEEIAGHDSVEVQEMPEAVVLTKTRAPRYTEIDFNEPAISDKAPSQTVIAAQQFKFRIGLGGKSNASSGERLVSGLKKQFN